MQEIHIKCDNGTCGKTVVIATVKEGESTAGIVHPLPAGWRVMPTRTAKYSNGQACERQPPGTELHTCPECSQIEKGVSL